MIFRSIQWSLQLWYGVILFLVLAGFGYTAFELQRTRELRRVDEELHEHLARVFGPLRQAGPGPGGRGPMRLRDPEERRPGQPLSRRELPDELPPNFERNITPDYEGPVYHIIWRRDGRVVRASRAPEEIHLPVIKEPAGAATRGQFRELVRITPRGDTILVGRSIQAELTELRRLALVLFGSGAGILALGLAGGWIAASRAMRPIENISSTAVKISSGDLSQRIPQDETESELGRLVTVLNSTFARLESTFSEQARFTIDVSHELRTPVSVIVSQTQSALGRERSAPEYRDALEACQRAAQRMRGLIESLLQLARLDAGQEQLRRDSFDLSEIAAENLALLAPLAQQHGVQLNSNLAPAPCRGDAGRVAQVIANLVTNAIRYTARGGSVTVNTSPHPSQKNLVRLTVTDTGIGIPPEDLPHIFDRFYRVDKSRSRDKGGSGLGLAISKAIISAHSGTIEVASGAGNGTTFTVLLPAAE